MQKTNLFSASRAGIRLRVLLILLAAFLLFPACKKGEPSTTAEPAAQATPVPEGPFELTDFVHSYNESTAADLERLASLLSGVEKKEDAQFGDAYFEGGGVILGLDLDGDDLDPILFCRVEGNSDLTVRGLRIGMDIEELKALYPELLTHAVSTGYMEFSETEGVELEFDDEFRISLIMYSVTR